VWWRHQVRFTSRRYRKVLIVASRQIWETCIAFFYHPFPYFRALRNRSVSCNDQRFCSLYNAPIANPEKRYLAAGVALMLQGIAVKTSYVREATDRGLPVPAAKSITTCFGARFPCERLSLRSLASGMTARLLQCAQFLLRTEAMCFC